VSASNASQALFFSFQILSLYSYNTTFAKKIVNYRGLIRIRLSQGTLDVTRSRDAFITLRRKDNAKKLLSNKNTILGISATSRNIFLNIDIDSVKSIVNKQSIYCIFPSFKSRDSTICILLHSFDLTFLHYTYLNWQKIQSNRKYRNESNFPPQILFFLMRHAVRQLFVFTLLTTAFRKITWRRLRYLQLEIHNTFLLL